MPETSRGPPGNSAQGRRHQSGPWRWDWVVGQKGCVSCPEQGSIGWLLWVVHMPPASSCRNVPATNGQEPLTHTTPSRGIVQVVKREFENLKLWKSSFRHCWALKRLVELLLFQRQVSICIQEPLGYKQKPHISLRVVSAVEYIEPFPIFFS